MKRKEFQFKHLAQVIMGQSPPGDTYNSEKIGVPLINGPTEFTDRFPVPKTWTTSPTRICKSGDILFCVRGSSTGRINRADQPYCLGRGVAAIRAKTSIEDTDYVEQQLLYCLNQLLRLSAGSTFPNIDRKSLESFAIEFHDPSDRRKIAAILTAWDRGIGALSRLIEARTRQQRGWRQRLLTGDSRFPEFGDTPWVECRLGDVVAATPRKVPKPAGPFLSAGLRSHGKGVFLKPSFEPGDIALEELFELRTDDLVVNITFAWEGAVAIVPPNADGALVSHRFPTFRFAGEQACPRYFAHLIRSKRFVAHCGLSSPGGAGRNRVLNVKSFLKMPLRIPSLPEQRRIAAALDAGEREVALLQRQLAALREQKRGLMQKLLTGEWRVKFDDSAKTSEAAPKQKTRTSGT